MSSNARDAYLDLLKMTLTGLTDVQPTRMKVHEDNSLEVIPLWNLNIRRVGRDWPNNGYTMVGLNRLDNVQACVEQVLADDVPGDFVETGIWRGGTSMFMRAMLKAYDVTDRVVYAADSFAGLPAPDAERYPLDEGSDLHSFDFLAVPRVTVENNFRRFGLMDRQVKFVEGWFRDTMPTLAGHTWSLIRMDGDLYESTITVLENLYPGLSPGGFVIVDDYGLRACRRAVDDYRSAHGIEDEVHRIDRIAAYWRKGP